MKAFAFIFFIEVYFSVIRLCSSCKERTIPQPGLCMDSIPLAVAFAAAMVVMYGIFLRIAALRRKLSSMVLSLPMGVLMIRSIFPFVIRSEVLGLPPSLIF